MDILLAHSYFLNLDSAEQRTMRVYPPLGLLYLSAHLKRRGLHAEVFDSTFRTKEEFRRIVQIKRPPMVGIYCNLITRQNVLEMIRDSKAAGASVILGGPEPSLHAREFLDSGADVIVAGEGEETLAELLTSIGHRGTEAQRGLCASVPLWPVQGIMYREQNGEVVQTPQRPLIRDLDSLPWPGRETIDLNPYLEGWREKHGVSSVSLITARGCPYTCTWCSRSVFGETHRRRSATDVADEVQWISDRYRPDMLWYADDVFTIHYGWLKQFAAELKRRNLRLPFECISRADRLNPEIAGVLQEMGCFRLWIGSESGSQKVLDLMDRRVTVAQVQDACRLLKQRGIQVGMFIMLGYEGEQQEDLEATAEHLKQSNPDLFLSTIAYPIKGTPYYHAVEARLQSHLPWKQRSDRDWRIRGRHSRRYYGYANQWLVGEFELHRQRRSEKRDFVLLAKSFAQSKMGRLGMRLSRKEVEA